MAKKTRRSFTKGYKAEVVELIRKSGKTVGAICRDLDLTETAAAVGFNRLKSIRAVGQRGR